VLDYVCRSTRSNAALMGARQNPWLRHDGRNTVSAETFAAPAGRKGNGTVVRGGARMDSRAGGKKPRQQGIRLRDRMGRRQSSPAGSKPDTDPNIDSNPIRCTAADKQRKGRAPVQTAGANHSRKISGTCTVDFAPAV